jgi:FkbM family methyltransferase
MQQIDDTIIRFTATPTSPFQVRRLPLLGHLYRAAYTQRQHFLGDDFRRVSRIFHHALRNAGLGGKGTVRLHQPEGDRDLRFNVRNTQFHALYMAAHLPCYEPATTALIERITAKTGTFFDIGANWGWYAVVVANRPGFAGRVHAFEPNPQSFADLVGIVSEAGLDSYVECHEIALSNYDGDMMMSLPDGFHSGLAKLDEDGEIRVRVARLDTLDLPTPDVIKIDVEDYEYHALLGAETVVATGRPIIIFENWSYPDRPELTFGPLRLLESWDYRLHYLAWLAENGEPYLKVKWSGGPARFGLVPFQSSYRGLLPAQANVVAVAKERLVPLRTTLEHGSPTSLERSDQGNPHCE